MSYGNVGYGMKSMFTSKMEVGDTVSAESWSDGSRLGKVVKKWKNGVLVVELEPVWIVTDENQLIVAARGAKLQKIKFNPDGHGRGDDYRWGSVKVVTDDVTADQIRREHGRANWFSLWAEAHEENIGFDDAQIARAKKQSNFETAQRVNKENRENMKTLPADFGDDTFEIEVLTITTKRGQRMVLLIIREEHDDPYPEAHDHAALEATAVVGRFEKDQWSRRIIPSVQSDNSFRTSASGEPGAASEKILQEIIFRYWDW